MRRLQGGGYSGRERNVCGQGLDSILISVATCLGVLRFSVDWDFEIMKKEDLGSV